MANGDTQTQAQPNPQASVAAPGAVSAPTTGNTSTVDAQTQAVLQMLMRAAAQKRMTAQPNLAPVPGKLPPPQPMGNRPGYGVLSVLNGVRTGIHNAVAEKKQREQIQGMNDWNYMESAFNELNAAKASGDQQATQLAQKKLDTFFQDDKKLKQMSKALNQDWLNPEKTNAYAQGVQQAQKQSQAKQAQQQNARTQLMKLFRMNRQPQFQPNAQQRQDIGREIQSKAPMDLGISGADQAKNMATMEQLLKTFKQNYQVVPTGDGTVVAVNKANPGDTRIITGPDGKPIEAKTTAQEGMPVMVNGMPIGVRHHGTVVMSGDQGWTDKDQKTFDAAQSSYQEKKALRVDPAILAMVGDPPDPAKFSGGRSDPEYGKALSAWGKATYQKELEKSAASGEARARVWNQYRPVQIMTTDPDGTSHVYYTTAANAIAQGAAGASEGTKLLSRNAQIADIETASGHMRDAIVNVDKPFDAAQIAKLKFALSTDNSTVASTELMALASQNLTDKQQDFVIWANQLNERAMSLRQVAGIGQGAQDIRGAIRAMLPGVGSGSKQMMTKQLNAFDQQVRVLKGGIAKPGKGGGPQQQQDFGAAPAGKKNGDTGTITKDGKTIKVVVQNGRIVAQQ